MSTADDIRDAEEANAAVLFVGYLLSLVAAVENLEKDPTKAASGMEGQDLVDAVALLQDLRTRLTMVERDLVTVAGRGMGRVVGSLSDGRQFTLERATDRKEWDHDDWKRDVRRIIATAVAEPYGGNNVVAMVGDDGEVFDLPLTGIIIEAITQAQEVHGSTAPRSRALKTLGLYAGDYSTSSPAGWRFSAVKPTTPSTTDTEETKTDG